MLSLEEVYWRNEDKGKSLDGTLSDTVVKEVSKLVPSGNPLPRESSCKLKSWLSYEHLRWPCTKSTTAPITKRQGIPKTLRNATLSPKAKERIRKEILLMRYTVRYRITVVILS